MSVICPTVLAEDEAEYASQMQKIAPFAKRIQIDLMDGDFASPRSVPLAKVWWPPNIKADLHLMYRHPMDHLDTIKKLKPQLVIFHVESMFHHMHLAAELHSEGIDAGLAILPETPIQNIEQIINSFDHLLIFSGNLGHFGGHADLDLLKKAKEVKIHHPDIEIGWDGGANDANAKQLADGGVDVINVGGYIKNSSNPSAAYKKLIDLIG